MMRHPVSRLVSLFYYLGRAEWEDGYREEFRNMTLLEYATSGNGDGFEQIRQDNWMVKYLSRKLKGELDANDLQLAKDVLKNKSLIGLTEDYHESMRRFVLFHGIRRDRDGSGGKNQTDCVRELMNQKVNENIHESVHPESQEWKALARANEYDLELYNYAKSLYEEQGNIIHFKEMKNQRQWNFRQN